MAWSAVPASRSQHWRRQTCGLGAAARWARCAHAVSWWGLPSFTFSSCSKVRSTWVRSSFVFWFAAMQNPAAAQAAEQVALLEEWVELLRARRAADAAQASWCCMYVK